MFARSLSVRSSLLARSLFTTPKVSGIVALPSKFEAVRNFNSSSALKNAAAADASKEEHPGPSAIIDKYGALTFWGMVATIAVTKEVFILDAEFLLALEIGAFATTTYVMAGNTVQDWAKETTAEEEKKFNEANDFMLTMLDQYKAVQQMNQSKPEVLEQYLGEFKDTVKAYAAYETVLPQHAARAKVIATLEGLQAKEEHAAAEEWANAVNKAVANVTGAFEDEKNTSLQKETLDAAIGAIGFEDVGEDQLDPVKRLFIAEFGESE